MRDEEKKRCITLPSKRSNYILKRKILKTTGMITSIHISMYQLIRNKLRQNCN